MLAFLDLADEFENFRFKVNSAAVKQRHAHISTGRFVENKKGFA